MSQWYSQAGQDEWVESLHPWPHFVAGEDWMPGYFVDVGAHDGVTHSNTYALERLGWKGLCIEPNMEAFTALTEARTCKAFPMIASTSCGTLPFDGVKVADTGQATMAAPLSMLLEAAHAPTAIGYLSIDVEGHELAVLHGMDFGRYTVDLITIEHNLYSDGPERKDAIYRHLTLYGFKRAREDVIADGYGPYEDWYTRA